MLPHISIKRELIIHESVGYDQYISYQKSKIDFLIENRMLKIDDEGKLRFTSVNILPALKEIWEFGSCSYWHYDKDARNGLDELLELGLLVDSIGESVPL